MTKEPGYEIIIGRNPVAEALKSGRGMEKLFIAKGAEGSIRRIAAMAKERGVPIYYREKEVLDKLSGAGNQGAVAFVSEYNYCEISDIMEIARIRDEDPFILILDSIWDPHNLGAIIRSAEAAGVHGIIIPKRGAAGITSSVAKASAGASEHMRCARVTNISGAIDELKSLGLWICACDMGGRLYYEADMKGPIGLVIGNEGKGIGRLVKEKCDFVLSIAMKGNVNSLNASNAAAILVYEVRRQRDGK